MTEQSPGESSEEPGGRVVWLRAGQDLMRSGGIGAVKIKALQREANLTTGSFYYHFSGMREFLRELAAFYDSGTEDHLRQSEHPDPKVRLQRLLEIAPRDGMHQLDMAMRDWAGSNEDAAVAVQRVDELLLGFVVVALEGLGFSQREARMRAHLLLSIGVSRVKPPWNVDYYDAIPALLAGVEADAVIGRSPAE